MKSLSKNILRTLMVIGALVMLMCAPVSAKTTTSVKAIKVGKTSTIKNTSKVTSSKKTVAQAKQKNSNAWKITGLKKGKSTLKVYDKNGKLSQKTYLIVYNNKTFKYDTTAITLTKGDSKKVTASTNISGISVKYNSSNKNVATVNANGKITAKGKGTATIKAVFYYKGVKIKTLKKNVTVNDQTSSSSSSSSSGSGSSAGSSSSNTATSSSGFEYHSDLKNYSLAGGRTYGGWIWTEKTSDSVTVKINNDCIEIISLEGPTARYDSVNQMDAYYTDLNFVTRKAGECKIGIYVNDILKETITITVTSTDDIYYTYLDWKQNMKDEIWTDDMTDREKIDAVGSYLRRENYVYISDQSGYMGWAIYGGGNCIAAADLVIDIAHDLGLEAEEYLVNGTYTGHVYAIVYYEPGVGTKVDISFY